MCQIWLSLKLMNKCLFVYLVQNRQIVPLKVWWNIVLSNVILIFQQTNIKIPGKK